MKNTAPHTTTSSSHAQQQAESQPFFQQEGEQGFFGGEPSVKAEPFFSPTGIQPKLTIGAPNDKYEQEADQVADQVVQRLAQPEASPSAIENKAASASETAGVQRSIAPPPPVPAARHIQRQEAPELEMQAEETQEDSIQLKPIFDSPGVGEESIQRKCSSCEAEEGMVQRFPSLGGRARVGHPALQRSGDDSLTTSDDFSSRLQRSKGSGSPMDSGTRSSMEGTIGTDFSAVRVHTGSEAASLSSDIGAQAFTHGSDVYFNEGKYDPGSSSGQHLLAHELTHTVQQGGTNFISRSPQQKAPSNNSGDIQATNLPGVINTKFPHLASVITEQQLAQLELALELRKKISRLEVKLKAEDESAKRKFHTYITSYQRRYPEMSILKYYSQDSGYYGIVSEIKDKEQRLRQPYNRVADKIVPLYDQVRKKQVIIVPTIKLLDYSILEQQEHNTTDEDNFRRRWFSKLSSQLTKVVLQPGLHPNPLIKLWWNGTELSHNGGLISFEHLKNLPGFRSDYYWNVSRGPSFQLLMDAYSKLKVEMTKGTGHHEFWIDANKDQRVVSFFAELFAWTDMPSMDIWDKPDNSLYLAKEKLHDGKIEEAIPILIEAEEEIIKSSNQINTYVKEVLNGAGRVITTLQVAEIAGAISSTFLSGGAGGAGLVRTSLAAARGAGTYGLVSASAGQVSEYGLGLRDNIDYGAIAKRGAVDFSTTLAGGLIAGKLSGPIARFMKLGEKTGVGRFVRSMGTEFISEGVAGGAISAATNLKDLYEGKISTGEYLSRIGWDSLKDGAIGAGTGMLGELWSLRGKLRSKDDSNFNLTDANSWSSVSIKVDKNTGEVFQILKHKEKDLDINLKYNPITEKVELSSPTHGDQTSSFTLDAKTARAEAAQQPTKKDQIENTLPMKLGKDDHEIQIRSIGGWKSFWMCSIQCGSISDKLDAILLDIPNVRPHKTLHKKLSSLRDRIRKVEQDINSGKISEEKIHSHTHGIRRSLKSINNKYPKVADMIEQRLKPSKIQSTPPSIEEIKHLLKNDNEGQARQRLAELIGLESGMNTQEVMRLLDNQRIKTDTAISRWEAALELEAKAGNISKDADTTEHLRIIDRPKGGTLFEQKIKGMLGEHKHAKEKFSDAPIDYQKTYSPQTRKVLREKLISEKDLLGFMDQFPPQGISQLELPSAYGTRIVDHAFIESQSVVLRESKSVTELKPTEKIKMQVVKDLNILDNFNDAVVVWRISGDLSPDMRVFLDEQVKFYGNRFSYELD